MCSRNPGCQELQEQIKEELQRQVAQCLVLMAVQQLDGFSSRTG